jgi:hypothetical protein
VALGQEPWGKGDRVLHEDHSTTSVEMRGWLSQDLGTSGQVGDFGGVHLIHPWETVYHQSLDSH